VGVLDRFERRLDRLVNGAFSKVFKSEVEPVELAAALTRECNDRAVIVTRGHTMAPNTYTVELGPTDFDRLGVYAEPLGAELAAMVTEHGQEQGYAFVGPVTVTLLERDSLATGQFLVASTAVSAPGPAPVSPRVVAAPDAVVDSRAVVAAPALGSVSPRVVAAPAPVAASLTLAGQRIPLTQRTTVLGRSDEADLRLDDPGVSRRHAQIVLADPPRLSDLNSTNGTFLEGVSVGSAELFDGARLRVGTTELTFHLGG